MKKSLWMLGAAVVALASCTNEEVLDVAQSKAISFESFVGKATKAVNDIDNTNITEFYVFGGYGNYTGEAIVFDGTKVTGNGGTWTTETTEYWIDTESYKFVAYSNGNTTTNASFDGANFNITDYTVGANDLMASEVVSRKGSDHSTVSMQLKHLLAKVKFTFASTLPVGYHIGISDLKFDADKNGDYNGSTGWTMGDPSSDQTYTFTVNGKATNGSPTESDEFYVIPQTATLNITFTATVTNGENGTTVTTKEFQAELTDNVWEKNNAYNYKAELTQSDFEDLSSKVIKFTPVVEGWGKYEDNTNTITPQSAN